jgi:hypothetical protein
LITPKMKRTYTLVVAFASLLTGCAWLSGCLTGCGPKGQQIKAIMSMTSRERQETFAKMPPEKQLELYFYGQHYEPPLNLHHYLAPTWKSLLPLVKQRLTSESDEKKVADMLALLEMVSVTQCSLVNRKDVLEIASGAAAKLRIDVYKGSARQSLNNLTHPAKQLPSASDLPDLPYLTTFEDSLYQPWAWCLTSAPRTQKITSSAIFVAWSATRSRFLATSSVSSA